jgi:hypothetical protein
MTVSGPAKPCPRCNTLLPMNAMFCGTCGLRLTPAPGPAGAAGAPPMIESGAPAANPQAPPGWVPGQPGYSPAPAGFSQQNQPGFPPQGPAGFPSQSQPGVPAQNQPAFPPPGPAGFVSQSQPGFAPQGPGGFAPPAQPGGYSGPPVAGGPMPAVPPRRPKLWLIVTLVVVVVLVGGGAAGFFLLRGHKSPAPGQPGVTDQRQGLPANVPLPAGVSFQLKDTKTFSPPGPGLGTANINKWVWTIGSPNTPTALGQYYQDNLPPKGWGNIKKSSSKEVTQRIGCQGNQVLVMQASTSYVSTSASGKVTNVTAPAGGAVLVINLAQSDNPLLVQALCSGAITLPNQ